MLRSSISMRILEHEHLPRIFCARSGRLRIVDGRGLRARTDEVEDLGAWRTPPIAAF